MFKKSNFLLVVSLILISALLLVGCGKSENTSSKQNPKQKTIKIGMNNWAENVAVTKMWKVLLEEKGYQVKIVNGQKAPIWAGLSKGDVDLFLDSWLPNTDQKYWIQYKQNLTKITAWYKNTGLGLAVPTYLKDVNTITDLKENKNKFMKNGEPSIVGIDSGASLMEMTNTALKKYDLDYNLIASSGPAMASSLGKAYKKKEAIVVTLWNPHWIFAEYDMKYLKDPKNVYGDSEDSYFIAHKGFKDEYPRVASWLENCRMNDKTLGSLMGKIKESDKAIQGAKKWIKNNRKVVNKWFN